MTKLTISAKNKMLRKALRECIKTLAMSVEPLPAEDPQFGAEVRSLGDRIGYGALMSSACASWRKKLETEYPGTEGGEHSSGPCVGTLQSLLAELRKVLRAT